MNHTKSGSKLVVAVNIAILLFSLILLSQFPQTPSTGIQAGPGLALRPPEFVRSAQAASLAQVDLNFILEEAGITAYTKLEQPLDLEKLQTYFKTIRQQTDQFITGIIVAPGYEKLPVFGENAEVQVFLHREGWVIAYLTKWQPASAIFDWVNYEKQRLTGTLVENVVKLVTEDVGGSGYRISYYDFRNPEATYLVLAAERVSVEHTSDAFDITIPPGVTIYEGSWSQAKFGRYYEAGECTLNDEQLNVVRPGPGQWALVTGNIVRAKFRSGTTHKVSAIVGGGLFYPNDPYVTQGYCGIAIVYGGAKN